MSCTACFIPEYSSTTRDVLFEFHLIFLNTASIWFQLEVYYKVDSLLTGLTAQQKGTTSRWYSNKTSLNMNYNLSKKVNKWKWELK